MSADAEKVVKKTKQNGRPVKGIDRACTLTRVHYRVEDRRKTCKKRKDTFRKVFKKSESLTEGEGEREKEIERE